MATLVPTDVRIAMRASESSLNDLEKSVTQLACAEHERTSVLAKEQSGNILRSIFENFHNSPTKLDRTYQQLVAHLDSLERGRKSTGGGAGEGRHKEKSKP